MAGRRRSRNASTERQLERRAAGIVEAGRIVSLGNDIYTVPSASVAGVHYEVAYNGNGWRCTCPYHERENRRRCKHIRAVENAVVQRRRIKDRAAKRLENP